MKTRVCGASIFKINWYIPGCASYFIKHSMLPLIARGAIRKNNGYLVVQKVLKGLFGLQLKKDNGLFEEDIIYIKLFKYIKVTQPELICSKLNMETP